MGFVRWDADSGIYAVVGLLGLAVFGYGLITTERTYYLHFPALVGVVISAYILLTAVVPDLGGRSGGMRRRALAAALFWTTTVVAVFVLWRAGL